MAQTVETMSPGAWVRLGALFLGFLKVSLLGFGGGLVWARRIVVERHQWMNEQEFAETLTLCQLMPGPNIVGIAVCVGSKLRGAIGAITAVGGFIFFACAAMCIAERPCFPCSLPVGLRLPLARAT